MSMLRSAVRMAVVAAALGALAAAPARAEFAESDVAAMHAFAKRLLETAKTGSSTTWRNGDGSIGGRVTITSTDHQPGSQPCRTYEWTMRARGGEELTGIGRGCRDGSGEWSLEETRSERQSSVATPPPPLTVRPPDPAPDKAPPRVAAPAKPAKAPAEKAPEAPAAAPAQAGAPPTPAQTLAALSFTRPPRTIGAGAGTQAPDAAEAQ